MSTWKACLSPLEVELGAPDNPKELTGLCGQEGISSWWRFHKLHQGWKPSQGSKEPSLHPPCGCSRSFRPMSRSCSAKERRSHLCLPKGGMHSFYNLNRRENGVYRWGSEERLF